MATDRLFSLLVCLVILLGFSPAANAEVRLPKVFGSHMVLQRDVPLDVWGWADPEEPVAVEFAGQSHRTVADSLGKWRITLQPLGLGEPRQLVVEGSNRIELDNVIVGDVWVCSGQSNMEWPLRAVAGGDLEVAGAKEENIRFLTLYGAGSQAPQEDIEGAWEQCNPATAANFSGIGYLFARRIVQTTGVPIGLIDNSWGGSAAEAWVPRAKLEGDALYRPLLERWDELATSADQNAVQEQYASQLDAWRTAMTEAQRGGEAIPEAPRPGHRLLGQSRPANLYEARIAPLTSVRIRGVIWYQGESNADRAYQYREMFPLLIQTWREAWSQGDFPFYWVQLADFKPQHPEPQESDWAELREAQTMTLSRLENVGEAVIIDVGDGKDIHPTNKQVVADRLVRWALARDYGVDLACASPRFQSLEIKGDKLEVTLSNCGPGLTILDTPQVQGFAIAGEDRQWHWATATIVGKDRLEVFSPAVPRPVAVRYAWADNPVCNLYALNSLPVTPFRSDDWPGVTADRR